MMAGHTLEFDVHMERGGGRTPTLKHGKAPPPPAVVGRTPRISKLMALAIRFQTLIDAGDVADYAEIARLGRVTRARATQIMDLLLLAPDIQEELLFLPPIVKGRDGLSEQVMRSVTREIGWSRQRQILQRLR